MIAIAGGLALFGALMVYSASAMMAMKEVEMAKASMKDGKMDDCSMHLGEAMKVQAPKM